uniref:efflux RND transporter periplasmic adaptor subunit n=1 Tax=Flavobacterium sp. TaxID=239 RepID=UPI004049C552
MKNYYSISVFLLIFTLLGCKKTETASKEVVAIPYKFFKATKTNTTLFSEYPAVLEGITDIEIRSKVDGYIEKIYVEEGQEVKKGQVLFQLETQIATQEVSAARARVDAAQLEVNRLMPLVERNIISSVTLETAKANLATVKSNYQSTLAAINYATIKSPINGVVGTIPLRIGSYVSAQTQQSLTRISDISSVYANFSINEKQQLELMMETEGTTFQDKISKIPPVQLILSNGMRYEFDGEIKTFSGQANTQTGSFKVRALFPNTNRILRSGGSGDIKIPIDLKDVILIPQYATLELQDKRIALIVDAESKVKAVPIEVRPVPGGQLFVVDKGLNVNDKVLIEGVGIVTEGTLIQPVSVDFNQVITSENKK